MHEKLKNFYEKNFNVFIIAVIALAFLIRLKYLSINQAVWWDEAEYLATAKTIRGMIDYGMGSQRQPLLSILISIFYFLGIYSEAIIKFFVVLLPSTAIVYLTYLLGKEIYDKHVGLIAAVIMATMPELTFWTARFSTDILGLFFGLLSFYFFWIGYVNKKDEKRNLQLMALFLGLGVLTRIGNVLYLFTIMVFILITSHYKALKNKNLWFAAIVSFLVILPYLIYNQIYKGNFMAFFKGYFGAKTAAAKFAKPFFWEALNYIYLYLGAVLFIFFIIGLYKLLELMLGFDLIWKENKEMQAHLFILLSVLLSMIYLIFIERNGEPRWAFMMTPGLFCFTAFGLLKARDITGKYLNAKVITMAALVLILVFAGYTAYADADGMIKQKAPAYKEIKEAALWMKDKITKNESVMTASPSQTPYYCECKHVTLGSNETDFEDRISRNNAKFVTMSIYERHPDWYQPYLRAHPEKFKPVQAFMLNNQPAVVIYEIIKLPDINEGLVFSR